MTFSFLLDDGLSLFVKEQEKTKITSRTERRDDLDVLTFLFRVRCHCVDGVLAY